MSSAISKIIKRTGSTRFGLHMTYIVLSMENPRLHNQPIHMQKLLSLTAAVLGYLELELFRNASNTDLQQLQLLSFYNNFLSIAVQFDFDFKFIMNELNHDNNEKG